MNRRTIQDGVYWMGAVDWDRRLFDSLIPLPDGTSYNAYLVEGKDKVALLDTVDPAMAETLMEQLADVPKVDYIVSHHAEQDHSGSIGLVLEKYPDAKVMCTPKAKDILIDLLAIPEEAFVTVSDGEQLALGGKTLTFVHTPWVHWPETMVT
ncbi:MAG: MBL fold metallo-hydrolase, partial [Actinobacteria bacterium]|nr:MBL fold metallo-hydrolase [Actinomycetota bacterium]